MKHIMIRNNLWEGKKDNLSRQASLHAETGSWRALACSDYL